jgi:hypothetical protein
MCIPSPGFDSSQRLWSLRNNCIQDGTIVGIKESTNICRISRTIVVIKGKRHHPHRVFVRNREKPQQVPPLRFPRFPVELVGVVALHAPLFTERRCTPRHRRLDRRLARPRTPLQVLCVGCAIVAPTHGVSLGLALEGGRGVSWSDCLRQSPCRGCRARQHQHLSGSTLRRRPPARHGSCQCCRACKRWRT